MSDPTTHEPERRNFNPLAATWDEEPRRVELARTIAAAMRNELRLGPEISLLDYGAGTGLVTLELAPHVGSVLAVDGSTGMLDVLQRKLAAGAIGNVQVQHAQLDRGGTIAGPFGVIVSSMTLHHIPEPLQLLRTLRDLLESDGTLALADLDEEGGRFHPDPTGVFHNGFSRQYLAELFDQAGLRDVRITDAATVEREHPTRGREQFTVFLALGRR